MPLILPHAYFFADPCWLTLALADPYCLMFAFAGPCFLALALYYFMQPYVTPFQLTLLHAYLMLLYAALCHPVFSYVVLRCPMLSSLRFDNRNAPNNTCYHNCSYLIAYKSYTTAKNCHTVARKRRCARLAERKFDIIDFLICNFCPIQPIFGK